MQTLEMILRGAGAGINGDDERESEVAGQDRQLKSNIVGYPESDDEDNSKVLGVEALPNKLLELKRQLTYLKNEFSQVRSHMKLALDYAYHWMQSTKASMLTCIGYIWIPIETLNKLTLVPRPPS